MTNRSLVLAIALSIPAGFAGGIASSSWLAPRPVYAQVTVPPSVPPPPAHVVPGDIQARRFLLTDANGKIYGVIGIRNGRPEIDLYDSDGTMIWRAPGTVHPYPTQSEQP
jgi:hypothetical protein